MPAPSLSIEATRTLDLPEANRTTDQVLINLSITEQQIIVTNDSDFVEPLFLRRELGSCC
jgi:predicted nuclease of predicted toxin-antitoxin system